MLDRLFDTYPDLLALDPSVTMSGPHGDGTPNNHGERTPQMHRFEGMSLPTPVTDIRGLIIQSMLAPGKRAARFRNRVCDVFVRCVGGDTDMVSNICRAHNLQTELRRTAPDHPLTAFGDAVASTTQSSDDDVVVKRRRLELEEAEHQVQLQRTLAQAEMIKVELAKAKAEGDMFINKAKAEVDVAQANAYKAKSESEMAGTEAI
jgi:hypothetical protein